MLQIDIELIVACSFFKIEIGVPSSVSTISYDIYLTHNKVLNYLRPVYPYVGLLHFVIGVAIAALASAMILSC